MKEARHDIQGSAMKKKMKLYSFLAILLVGIIGFGVIETNQLSDIRATLETTQNELADIQSDLSNAEGTLAATETELSQTQAELTATETDVENNLKEIDSLIGQLDSLLSQVNQIETEYQATAAALTNEKASGQTLQDNIDNLLLNIGFLTTDYGYIMKNPTYQACKAFIAADQTDKREDIDGVYEAVNFAMDVKTNALRQKIRCGYVSVRIAGGSLQYILIAFNTTDRGIIYIYPPTDEEVNLQVGKHFWTQCVIPNADYYYTNPTTYDDTVVRFNTSW